MIPFDDPMSVYQRQKADARRKHNREQRLHQGWADDPGLERVSRPRRRDNTDSALMVSLAHVDRNEARKQAGAEAASYQGDLIEDIAKAAADPGNWKEPKRYRRD